jgi:probable O-glycosylation ligase (exosortase A-associated)
VLKIMTMTFVTMMVIKTRRQLYLLIWTMVCSLAYYGVKGGVFTALSGGSSIVWGPAGSYIEGNNELALALITLIPIMYALFMEAQNKWVRRGLLAMMLLCGLSALGSYSRGALLAIAAMIVFLWLKSPKKAMVGALLILLFPLAIVFMPDKWTERMETIQTYKEDSSAMGRINAWHMAYNLAKDRPLVGGGFDVWTGPVFALYAPEPLDVHAAHSIYFQVLGEHGFVGLGLYLLLCVQTWRAGTWIMRNTKRREDLKWAYGLANMLHVSMIGFGVGGAFLSLLYFDVPYYLMAVMVILQALVRKELEASPVNYPRKASFSPKPVA